jgi:hypothetical protein
MTVENTPTLCALDPESEACSVALTNFIKEEFAARIAFGDDPHSAEGQQILSELLRLA